MPAESPEIRTDDLTWDEAVVEEGRRPGSVVSVRLDADETARLRRLAESSGLNLSQVIRRAVAAYEAEEREPAARVVLGAFTHGGAVPTHYEQMWTWLVSAQLAMPEEERTGSGDPVPTSTEPIRIVERVVST